MNCGFLDTWVWITLWASYLFFTTVVMDGYTARHENIVPKVAKAMMVFREPSGRFLPIFKL